MKSFKCRLWGMSVVAVAAVLAVGAQGCEDNPIAQACGLECPATGIVEGNAAISGLGNIDAFFGAVVDFNVAAKANAGAIRGRLDAIAASVGLEPGASGAEIKAALEAHLAANVQGGLTLNYEPAKCSASADVVLEAQAKCDAEFDPGSAKVSCSGSCEVKGNISAQCDAQGNLSCTAKGPSVECSGTCSGSCELSVAAACEGTCRGECSGQCEVRDAQGNCAGKCEGNCQGSCELAAGGSCSGSCQGECAVELPSAECEAMAEVSCSAEAMGSIECNGGCDAEVTPPSAKAECQASAQAKANVSVECTPPRLDITFDWSAEVSGDAAAKAEFRAWIENFKIQYAALLAEIKRSEFVLEAGADLTAAASGAVETSINTAISATSETDIRAWVGLGCAVQELPNVGSAIAEGTTALQGSVTAAAEVSAAIGT